MTDEERVRRRKKTEALRRLADKIQGLRQKVTQDLKSDDEKVRLTALAVALIDRTAERVGNEESAENGHFGVTGFLKSHIAVDGNTIHLKYVGKSGVDHDKQFTDETVAKVVKECLDRCKGDDSPVLVTSDGFKVKADKVNRYLSEYEVTAKDIRGYAANDLMVRLLKGAKVSEDEDERRKKFREVMKTVAEKVGHQQATLKKHYLLPGLEEEYVSKGVVPSIKEAAVAGRLYLDMMSMRVASDVIRSRMEEIVEEMARSVAGRVEEACVRVVGKPSRMPSEIDVEIADDEIPEGKVAQYVPPDGHDVGVLRVRSKLFDSPDVLKIAISHELCHAALGHVVNEGSHDEEFQKLAAAMGIPKDMRD
jgi:hypothetical protein